jgi:hypothetical protein
VSVSALRRALVAGSLSAFVIDLWMLAGPHWSLTRDTAPLGGFYDAQGRAFLDGHLAVPESQAGFEGFEIDGGTYLYFGPVLALLRLPVLLVTHRLDGRMTQLSMLLALVVLLGATGALYERVRGLVRPDAATIGRAELALAFLVTFTVGAGSVVLYLAATPVVYEETELWGAALALATFVAILAVIERPTIARIAWAGGLATLTVNTRVAVGLGPIVALAFLTAASAAMLLAPSIRRGGASRAVGFAASFGPLRPARGRAVLVALAIATLVPVVTSAAVNQAKFGMPFGLPMEKQVFTRLDANRRAALAANGGTIFGPRFVPTTLLAALRPDAVGAVRAFPFVGLPADVPHVVGDVRFDTLQRSLSAPTSMPLLCLLTLVALVGLVARRRLRPLLGVLVAAAAGYAGALTIGYVTTRYLADLVPFLALGALTGLQLLLARGVPARMLVAGAGVLAVGGLAINAATGLVDQRLAGPLASEPDRAAFVRAQDDVDRFLGRRPSGVRTAARMPAPASARVGDLLVVGRCAGFYVVNSFGTWVPVERTPATGYHVMRLRDAQALGAQPRAFLTRGAIAVSARRAPGGVVLGLRVRRQPVRESGPVALDPGTPFLVSFAAGGALSSVSVRVAGREVVGVLAPDSTGAPYRVDAHVAEELPASTPVCAKVARRAGLAGPS